VCVCVKGWKEGERECVRMQEILCVHMCEFRMTLKQGGAVCVRDKRKGGNMCLPLVSI